MISPHCATRRSHSTTEKPTFCDGTGDLATPCLRTSLLQSRRRVAFLMDARPLHNEEKKKKKKKRGGQSRTPPAPLLPRYTTSGVPWGTYQLRQDHQVPSPGLSKTRSCSPMLTSRWTRARGRGKAKPATPARHCYASRNHPGERNVPREVKQLSAMKSRDKPTTLPSAEAFCRDLHHSPGSVVVPRPIDNHEGIQSKGLEEQRYCR